MRYFDWDILTETFWERHFKWDILSATFLASFSQTSKWRIQKLKKGSTFSTLWLKDSGFTWLLRRGWLEQTMSPAGMLTIVCLRGPPHANSERHYGSGIVVLTNLLSYHNGSANTLIRVHTVHKIWRATAAELNEQPLLAIKTIWLPGFPKYWRWLSFPA